MLGGDNKATSKSRKLCWTVIACIYRCRLHHISTAVTGL